MIEGFKVTLLNIIGIAAGSLVLLIVAYIVLKKTPKKYYKKARKAHKKGEKFYLIGDKELADAYYALAEDYRSKAQGMQ